jgi:hypothetical protein
MNVDIVINEFEHASALLTVDDQRFRMLDCHYSKGLVKSTLEVQGVPEEFLELGITGSFLGVKFKGHLLCCQPKQTFDHLNFQGTYLINWQEG